jgi:hypothetical protein
MALNENLLALCRAARARDAHAVVALADLLTETGDSALTAAAIRSVLHMDDPDGKSLAEFFRTRGAGVRVCKLVWRLAAKLGLDPGQVAVDDLTAQTPADLLEFPNFGYSSLRQVRIFLHENGLRLRGD